MILRVWGNSDFSFHEIVCQSDTLSKLNYCIWNWKTQLKTCGCGLGKQIKSSKKTRRHKMLMACKLCPCDICHNLMLYLNTVYMFHGRRGIRSPGPRTFPLRLWARDMQHFKTKNLLIFLSSQRVKFFDSFIPYLITV